MVLLALAIALVLLVASAVLSAAETSLMLLSPGRIHRLAESQRRGSRALDTLAESRHRLRAVSSLVGGLAFSSAAVAGVLFGERLLPDSSDSSLTTAWLVVTGGMVGAIIAVLLMYAFAQALPRTLAATNPERVALDTARFVLPVMRTLYPIAAFLGAPWKWAVSVAGGERAFSPWAVTPEWRGVERDEEGEREGAEEALLEAVSDFADKVVREVMVPRTDMKALADTASLADAVETISATGYSRIPIYHGTVDDVRGVLYAKDLLATLALGETQRRVMELARAPYFVPETKPVEELLVEMRSRTHIAIVADEYGGTAGLVTLEDLLEEIVGEISDEYDTEEPLVVDLGEGRYRVDARLPVDDLNEVFGTDIDLDADSVGGLFTEVAGRIPERGESVLIEGLRLTVTQLEGTRIRQLSVEPAGGDDKGERDA